MKTTIWKYPLPIRDEVILKMPMDPRFLFVAVQDDVLSLWALVAPEAGLWPRRIRIYGTGNPGPQLGECYIGSVQKGPFVWHVFDAGHVKEWSEKG